MMDTLVIPGDVIAVKVDGKLSFYARVEEILLDVKRGWRKMRFLVLSDPPRELTWILEPVQIDGEPFTMGGTKINIERLPAPEPEEVSEQDQPQSEKPKENGQVITFPSPGEQN
jgi:hypothetical protein